MPLFEFRCDACDHREERLQKHDDPPPVCATCDEAMPDETPYMTRLVSQTSFRLKGSGWARDGYGR